MAQLKTILGCILVALLLFSYPSCSSDDDGKSETADVIASHNFGAPVEVAVDSTANRLFVAEQRGKKIEIFATGDFSFIGEIALDAEPSGLAISPDDAYAFVTAGETDGRVLAVDLNERIITESLEVGHTPVSPIVSNDGATLYVANRFDDTVSIIDLSDYQERIVSVSREPIDLGLSEPYRTLVVAHHLPEGPADTGFTSAAVSLIDLDENSVYARISLPDGSTGVRGVAVSPDGEYAYVTHVLAQYKMPTTQLDRGWLIKNALSIIDIPSQSLLNTVLLDDVYHGAANPWAIVCSADGHFLLVTHGGTHEISIIDRPGMHRRLDEIPYPGGFSVTPDDVPNDLGFLSGLRKRIALAGNGPRSLAVTASNVYIAEYFSDSLDVLQGFDTDEPVLLSIAPDENDWSVDQERLGRTYFNDASQTYQGWLSCASCHPDGRADGLNWDLGNDGLGSPRNAKSLLFSHYTPPAMITGIRADAETAVRAGFKFIEFAVRPETDSEAVDEFLKGMEPVSSPYLVNGELSDAALRGKSLFQQAQCGACHFGEYLTDLESYDVGTGREEGELLDTPTLIEVWRTAPYLQDGRAATMTEVLTTFNPDDLHGDTSGLSEEEINDLAEYVLSL